MGHWPLSLNVACSCSQGYGFVSYDSPTAAAAAVRSMDDTELMGRRIKVQIKAERG